MPVVSISINEKLLGKLEDLEENLGYSGRSEVIRTAIRNYIDQKEKLDRMEGEKTAVMNVKHQHDAALETHDFQDLIRSQLHDHDEDGDCIQVFILQGKAKEIIEVKEHLQSNKKVLKTNITTY